jgi:hypothetical protein
MTGFHRQENISGQSIKHGCKIQSSLKGTNDSFSPLRILKQGSRLKVQRAVIHSVVKACPV